MRSTAEALRAILSPEVRDDAPVALDAPSWDLLLEVARVERLLGLVADARSRGAIVLTARQEETLHGDLREVALTDLRRSRVVTDVAVAWRCEGIDFRVIKGLAAAAQLYRSTSVRDTGDFDVAVRPEDIERATAVLVDRGYRMAHPFRGRAHRSVCRSITVRHRTGVEVDIHRRYGSGGCYERDEVLSPFFRPCVTVVQDGVDLPMVGLVDLLIAAVAHSSRGAGLSTAADLLRVGAALRDAGSEAEAVEAATRLPLGSRSAASRLVAPWSDDVGVSVPWLWRTGRGRAPAAALLRAAASTKFSEVGLCSAREAIPFFAEFVWPTDEWRQYRRSSRAVTSAERRWHETIDALARVSES